MIHSYWPDTSTRRLPDVKSWLATSSRGVRPVVVEEFGWPSEGDGTQYSPLLQLQFYQQQLPGFRANNVSACLQWQAFDLAERGKSSSFESYFGLWMMNETALPVLDYYASFPL